MDRPSEQQVQEFLAKFPGSKQFTEPAGADGLLYLYIPEFQLSEGIQPAKVDVLLCPLEHAGYKSRLYYAQRLAGGQAGGRNWNGTVHVLGRSWQAFSWETPAGLTLLQMLSTHVRALYEN